ncbi:MAG: tetratricopeptide repeat protein, partial [Candidatus Zixiibacteriota bacterium]
GPLPNKFIEKSLTKIDNWLWGKRLLPRILFISTITILFYLLRIKTFFLGDGYTWISAFGESHAYIHKSTEFLSILILRFIQTLSGEYSNKTSLLAFRILSFGSGVLFITNIIYIIGSLTKYARVRILALVTIIFSGASLLFMGYVEFYPVLWATASLFILSALRFLDKQKGFHWVILSFILVITMHLQAVYYILGVGLLLIYNKYSKRAIPRMPKKYLCIVGLIIITGLIAFFWMYLTKFEFALLFLPLMKGYPRTPGYAIFSSDHLYDIFNQILLLIPGILLLTGLIFLNIKRIKIDKKLMLLTLLSIGSIIFLFVIDPYIGLPRDWDLMSLTLFAPALLILYLISLLKNRISNRVLLIFSITCLFISSTFLAVNNSITASENRFYSLLKNDPENRDRNGWLIYANYFLEKGDENFRNKIVQEMRNRFPEYTQLEYSCFLIQKGRLAEAKQIGSRLYENDPYNIKYLLLLGDIYTGYLQYDSAKYCYQRALAMKPYAADIKGRLGNMYLLSQDYEKAVDILQEVLKTEPGRTTIMESLAFAYIKLNYIKNAINLADTLFLADTHSPSANIIMMSVSLTNNDTVSAKRSYDAFLKHGANRPDYENIKKSYSFLIEEKN